VNTILDERFNIETSTIKERVRKTTKKRAQMKMLLTKVAENQAKYYNLKHTSMIYNVGDKVLLNVKNIIFTRSFKKLDYVLWLIWDNRVNRETSLQTEIIIFIERDS
jgi:hypothetical protein